MTFNQVVRGSNPRTLMWNKQFCLFYFFRKRSPRISADMAELADAPDLGSGVYDVQVQVLLSALNQISESLENTVIQGFLFLTFEEMGRKRGKLKSVLRFGSARTLSLLAFQ